MTLTFEPLVHHPLCIDAEWIPPPNALIYFLCHAHTDITETKLMDPSFIVSPVIPIPHIRQNSEPPDSIYLIRESPVKE